MTEERVAIYGIPPRVDYDENDDNDPDQGREVIIHGRNLTAEQVVKIADNQRWVAQRAWKTARRWQRIAHHLAPPSGDPSPYYAGGDAGKPIKELNGCPWRMMEALSLFLDRQSETEVADLLEDIYASLPRIDDPRVTYEDAATLVFLEALSGWLRRRAGSADEDATPEDLEAKAAGAQAQADELRAYLSQRQAEGG